LSIKSNDTGDTRHTGDKLYYIMEDNNEELDNNNKLLTISASIV